MADLPTDLEHRTGIQREVWAALTNPRVLAGLPPQDQLIGITDAAHKYGFKPDTVYRWVRRGAITVVVPAQKRGRTHKNLIRERDVAARARRRDGIAP